MTLKGGVKNADGLGTSEPQKEHIGEFHGFFFSSCIWDCAGEPGNLEMTMDPNKKNDLTEAHFLLSKNQEMGSLMKE